MSYRRSLALAVLATCFAAPVASWAAGQAKGQIPGYLDVRSGQFVATPNPPFSADLGPDAQAVYSGTFSLKFVITLKSGIPSDWPIHCTQTVSVIDVSGLNYTSSKTAIATRNGSTATCLVNVNYSWLLNSASDQVYTNFMVNTFGTNPILEQVDATGTLAPITVPPNGQTTARTVNVTL
jgi:hypothetical protein